MDPIEQAVRTENPDWSDEQVHAEVTKRKQAPPPTDPPADPDRDRAFAEMRRRTEQAEAEAQRLRDEQAERDRKQAEEQGEFQRLYEEQKAENERIAREAAAQKAAADAERSARDMKFRDPGYALYLLRQDSVDLTDPVAVKQALAGLAEQRQDLLATGAPPPSGGPAGGNGGGGDPPALTAAQIGAMSPKEVAALDPAVLNRALAQP